MAAGDYTIPRANAAITDDRGAPTSAWYNYLRFIGSTSQAALLADITTISDKLGSPDGTPENIPPLPTGGGGTITGVESVQTWGALPGVVQLSLVGDTNHPGNTFYYGTGPSGTKGWFTVASTLLGTAGDITLTVGANGVTTFDLAPVTDSGAGALLAITRDSKGRVSGTRAATLTGTANRVSVTNGDASAGVPTIDIAATYAGQASIVTLGTVTTGTWNATTLAIAHGGTGQTAAAAAFDALAPTTTNQDLIVRGLTSNGRLGVGANGTVLTVSAGSLVWAPPATSGTVTSVGLGAPVQFNVSGSPVTGSGTLAFAWNAQTANAVLAGPTAGADAAPTFRALVAADIPFPADYIIGLKLIYVSATSIQVTGGEAVIQSTGLLETVASPITVTGISLAAATLAHVYLYNNAGVPSIEVATTGPAAPYQGTARSKTGDTSRRYLGSILSGAANTINSFVHSLEQGRVDYRVSNLTGNLVILGNGRATVSTSVSAASVAPTTATHIIMFGYNDPATTQTVYYSASDGPTVPSGLEGFVVAGSQISAMLRVDSSQAFTYAYAGTVAGTTQGFTVRVSGYTFER